ncbi:AEC family transporter [Thiovibrio frasassiensis]|uniref:AEC family transporter n=1 Tax=Thiovibrio frasassiensis TaxID=2984131 RepID=A0A9X4RMV9_9BACT|nr:AEC family transporter [Thiovibrio frasassiensis]MDG4476645.1 AEC family transporter [Thiovibrio frasassiensis]
MENFILTISFLLMGMGLRRLPNFPKETPQVLNLFAITLSLPALILLKVPQLAFSTDILVPVLMPWAMLTISALMILLLAKRFSWEKEVVGVLLLLIPLGNTSFFGIPMVQAFFGDTGIPYAVLYDQLGSFVALATYGTIVLAFYGSGGKPTPTSVLTRVISFPPFIALLLALACRGILFPQPLLTLLNALATTLVPVVMVAIGFQLTLRLTPDTLKPLGIGLVIKLAVAPLLALLLCRILGLNTLAAQVAIFEAGMPPMVSAGALAIMAGLSPKLTAALIGLGIIFSFLTLPLLYQLL